MLCGGDISLLLSPVSSSSSSVPIPYRGMMMMMTSFPQPREAQAFFGGFPGSRGSMRDMGGVRSRGAGIWVRHEDKLNLSGEREVKRRCCSNMNREVVPPQTLSPPLDTKQGGAGRAPSSRQPLPQPFVQPWTLMAHPSAAVSH